MAEILSLVVSVVIFALVLLDFVARSWRLPVGSVGAQTLAARSLAAPDRWGQLVALLVVICAFVVARSLVVAPGLAGAVWLAGAALTAFGVFGAVVTWGRRPWLREHRPRARIASLVADGVIAVALIGLFA